MALTINVFMSNNGVFPAGLGGFKPFTTGSAAGKTVNQILADANGILGGCATPAILAGACTPTSTASSIRSTTRSTSRTGQTIQLGAVRSFGVAPPSFISTGVRLLGVMNPSESKQITVWGDARNKADHGKFNEIAFTEVVTMIPGVRAFTPLLLRLEQRNVYFFVVGARAFSSCTQVRAAMVLLARGSTMAAAYRWICGRAC